MSVKTTAEGALAQIRDVLLGRRFANVLAENELRALLLILERHDNPQTEAALGAPEDGSGD